MVGIGSLEDVILHSLKALRDSLPADSVLTAQNCSFGYLSKAKPFEVIEDEQIIQAYLDKLPVVVSRVSAPVDEPPAEIEEPSIPTAEEPVSPSAMDVDPSDDS